ncbi:carboxypeptidase regulatory-like domain-containing protein [Cohnella candidum]|nr:carboxypeptidase regulatory-like domain-containing protein [Cohnella candidum]
MLLSLRKKTLSLLAVFLIIGTLLLPQFAAAQDTPHPGVLQLSQSEYSVIENAGTLTVTVNRTGGSDGNIGVEYCDCAITATRNVDYQYVHGWLQFADGETSKTFQVHIIDDTAVEGPETFRLLLKGTTGGATLANPPYSIVTIVDDDQPAPAEQGTVKGKVADAITLASLTGATVDVYDSSNVKVTTVTTDDSGQYSLTLPAGSYKIVASKTGYSSENNLVTVTANTDTFNSPLYLVPVANQGNGTVSGTITNALTGLPVPGLTLTFRKGQNVFDGPSSGTATTDQSGQYTIDLPSGNYTAEITGTGYLPSSILVVAVGGTVKDHQDGTVTPTLAEDEIRIVLNWGASPSDLDSHLTGPNGASRFHVYYSNSTYDTDTTDASLDIDDTTSFGPETITLKHPGDGVYRYSVHDYTNRFSNSSQALSNSGAVVNVYQGSNLLATFYAPTDTAGTLWTVFEINNGVFVPVNQLKFNSDSSNVSAF